MDENTKATETQEVMPEKKKDPRKFIERVKRLKHKNKKSNMEIWAEKEVELAIAYDQKDLKDKFFGEYSRMCYGSALKTFKTLLGQGHSGMSIVVTKHILDRLIENRPLSPIEDTPDIWRKVDDDYKDETVYQCNRMWSLFKHVKKDGGIYYTCNDSSYCIDLDDGVTYSSKFVREFVDNLYPITMPYWPTRPIKVYCSEILSDVHNGDFDTRTIHYLILADDTRVVIGKHFKEGPDCTWIEIDDDEYNERVEAANKIIQARKMALEVQKSFKFYEPTTTKVN